MTLSTQSSEGVWSTPLFYVYDKEGKRLIFTSSVDTLHIKNGREFNEVSCAVSSSSMVVARLKGAQIRGLFCEVEQGSEQEKLLQRLYLKRFSFAVGRLDRMWFVEITSVKYTDNSLGFGSKLFYSRDFN